LAAAGSLAAFLAVGLFASVKIGGGNNLHNLDMFLVALLMLAGHFARRRRAAAGLGLVTSVLLALIGLVPIWFGMRSGGPRELPPEALVRESLNRVRSMALEAADRGEVLFIDQRQLFTFGNITGVPLVVDYELKDMMNQAMGDNTAYFERFRADLAAARFELIVSDPLPIVFKGGEGPFPEENDAWVEHVTLPILEHYRRVTELPEVGVWLLAPKEGD
jgi:hypothetical protein